MKKILSTLILSALTTLAFASDDHAGGHDHDMSGMHQEQHGDTQTSLTGKPGDPAKVSRTIKVTMEEIMRFTPSNISVKTGETIRLYIQNADKVPHEMVIGSMGEMKELAEMMRKMPGMKHAEPNMITVTLGKSDGLVWQFDNAGTVNFAYLIPGHIEAGMTGKVEVK